MYSFTYIYLSGEIPVYQCDFVEQNLFWHDFSLLLKENFSLFLQNFKHDIFFLNRNPFCILPLIPFYFLFPNFRFGFIFSVEIIYLLPVLLLIWFVFYKFFILYKQNTGIIFIKKRKLLLFLSSIFLFPSIWYSVLSGLPDIIGMIFILICFILYFKYQFNKKIPNKILFLFSILLYFSFLSRRWYSVVILAFLVSILIENFIISIKANDRIKKIAFTILNLSIPPIIISILAMIIQGGYFRNIIQNEIAERNLYVMNFNQFDILFGHIGFFVLFIAFIGLICNFKIKLVRFCFFNLIVYLFLFFVVMNNQLLWINHFVYIAILVSILYICGLYSILDFIKNINIKNIFIILVIIFNILNFYTFFLVERPKYIQFLLPKTTAYPKKSFDFNKILKLYNYLEEEYNKNQNIKIVIYGLNNEIGYYQFRSINPDCKFTNNIKDRITNDSFEDALYNEDFVIIFNPLGLYAPDEYNTKIKEISEMFKNNTGYAKKYKKVQELELEDNNKTKVILYKRK